jgi:two-component system response regulator TtrR
VVAGKLNREIAEDSDISVKTVEAHRAKIMEKLEVDSLPSWSRRAAGRLGPARAAAP